MRIFAAVVGVSACATLGALMAAMPAFGQGQPAADRQPAVNTSAVPPQPGTAEAPARMPAKTALAKPGAHAASGKSAHPGKAMDRIDLDAIQITGNKELPNVIYVVPWKHSELGDLTGKPANSLVDEILQPVDRDVFNREERYYHTVGPQKGPADPKEGVPAQH